MFARPKRQKQVLIDQQIHFVHAHMVEKVLQKPVLFSQLSDTLEARYRSGMMRYGSYILWQSILSRQDCPKTFRELVLAEDSRTASLRRSTIFTGILTEEERESVLAAYAASQV